MTDLSDTSTWLPLDGLEPGFDANKPPASDRLDGRTVTLRDSNDHSTRYDFTDPGTYEAFEIAEQLYYVQLRVSNQPNEAVSLVLDFATGRCVTITSTIGETGIPRVKQAVDPGMIDGIEPRGAAAAPSIDLIGRRVLWTYSPQHSYEHIYLSPHWYTWQCLAGPEVGLADTDEHTTLVIRPGIYVFAWREKVIPCGSVTLADHRNVRDIRSVGMLFGLGADGVSRTQFTFGARGRLLSVTTHPADRDPARAGAQ
jgi:hypothetical protein